MYKIRLNKALTLLGICSRRDADKLIESGEILINSNQIATKGIQISENDVISVLGKNYTLQTSSITKRIWIYYKPKGLVTTHKDEKNRTTVFDALKKKIPERVISVGRLDLNSEGLLLITTDNDFAKYAQSPDNGWERKYKVRLFGIPNEKIISALMQGIEINKIQYKPMQVRIISQSKGKNCWVDCALTEGKNREIRKVFEHFGIMVNKLIRYKYGPYELGNLTPTQLIEVNFKNI